MGTRSSTAQKFISDEITQALLRAGLDYDHPIREVLDREAEIVGVRDAVVRVRDERNQMLMLDDRIKELRHDPSYAHSFPADPPKVAKTDMGKLTENFDKVASGEVRVGRSHFFEIDLAAGGHSGVLWRGAFTVSGLTVSDQHSPPGVRSAARRLA